MLLSAVIFAGVQLPPPVTMMYLKPLLLTFGLLLALTMAGRAQVNVTMWGVDHAHSFLNNQETILTPSNVSSTSFGQLFTHSVDGQVYGQVLYASSLGIAGGTHNVRLRRNAALRRLRLRRRLQHRH